MKKVELNKIKSRDRIEIRKKRKKIKEKRLKLISEISKFLDDPQNEVNFKGFGCLEYKDYVKYQKLEKMREDLLKLSNKKGYNIEFNESEQYQVWETADNQIAPLAKTIGEIDLILEPQQVAEMRERMGLIDIANKYDIQYKALNNWCYNRGVNKLLEGKKVVVKRWKNK